MRAVLCLSILVAMLPACGTEAEEPFGAPEELDVATDELLASAPPLPLAVERALRSSKGVPAQLLDHVFTIEHFVRVKHGRKIHVTESFTLRSFLRWPHRAMLMLPGPLVKGDFFNIEVDGYRGRDRMAQRGFFAISVDLEGSGESSYPDDGRNISSEDHLLGMRRVVQYFRALRLVPRVDILGESRGGGIAADLCADAVRVRSCTLASMLYKTPSDFANATFRSLQFLAMLDSLPDGYLTTAPETYAPIIGRSPEPVRDWVEATQPGRYATSVLYDAFDLPFFDPTAARVPGLIIQGELDPNQPLSDAYELSNDWDATPAEVVVVPGAGHIPRVEPRAQSEIYWDAVERFVDP